MTGSHAISKTRSCKSATGLDRFKRSVLVIFSPHYRRTCLLVALGLFSSAGLITGCATTDPDTSASNTDISELVWPLPPEQPRIKYLRMLFSEDQIVPPKSTMSRLRDSILGKSDEGGHQLKKPYAVHADNKGRVFVADSGWGKVLVFDEKNKSFDIWGKQGKGILAKPLGITSDSNGNIYVTDSVKQRIVMYSPDGNFVHAIGQKGELKRPIGIAVDEDRNRIYVVDSKAHQIVVYNEAGTLLERIGTRGTEPGQFNIPTNIAVDSSGKLYVTDSMNFRVQILSSKGEPIRQFGSNGDGRGQFVRAKGIDVDSHGNIYVADAAFNNLQIFNQQGQLLMALGSPGRNPGQFQLPAGIHIDDADNIYVADQYNWRIQIFQFLNKTDGSKSNNAITGADKDTPETS